MKTKSKFKTLIPKIARALVGLYAVNLIGNAYLVDGTRQELSQIPDYISAQQKIMNLAQKRFDSCAEESEIERMINNPSPIEFDDYYTTREILLDRKRMAHNECNSAKQEIKEIWNEARENNNEVDRLTGNLGKYYTRMVNPFYQIL